MLQNDRYAPFGPSHAMTHAAAASLGSPNMGSPTYLSPFPATVPSAGYGHPWLSAYHSLLMAAAMPGHQISPSFASPGVDKLYNFKINYDNRKKTFLLFQSPG